MFRIDRKTRHEIWLAVFATSIGFSFSDTVAAQGITTGVGNSNPLNLESFIPSDSDLDLDLDLGISDSLKGDFYYGLALGTEYNSNFFLTDDNEQDEISFLVTPLITYSSDPEGGAPISFNASYTPIYQAYADNSDLNSFDNSGNVVLTFRGGKTQVAVFGRYAEVSATDRFTGTFVNGSLFTYGVRANRQMAPRTTMNAGFSGAMSDYGTSVDQGADIYSTYVGGLWTATQRIGLGATLRYNLTDSPNITSRESWALLGEARYRLGERIFFSASVGPQYSYNSSGPSDSSVGATGNINARYVINERLTWNSAINSAIVPSPTATNYLFNDVSLTTDLQRQLNRGRLKGGLRYSFSGSESVGTVNTTLDNESVITGFVGFNRSLFSERLDFNTMLEYSVNNGQTDWQRLLLRLGMNVSF